MLQARIIDFPEFIFSIFTLFNTRYGEKKG